MLEIDFKRVETTPADVPFYAAVEAPVRVPPYLAVRCLDEHRCQDCGDEGGKRRGMIAWLTVRNDERTPTQWVTLCEEHFEKTKRKKPQIIP